MVVTTLTTTQQPTPSKYTHSKTNNNRLHIVQIV